MYLKTILLLSLLGELVNADCVKAFQDCSADYISNILKHLTVDGFCQYTRTYTTCMLSQSGCSFSETDERYLINTINEKIKQTGFTCTFTPEEIIKELKHRSAATHLCVPVSVVVIAVFFNFLKIWLF